MESRVKYKWTRNGEVLAGVEGDTLNAVWRKAKTPDSYTVAPIYLINGDEVEGESAAFTVTNLPRGTVVLLR